MINTTQENCSGFNVSKWYFSLEIPNVPKGMFLQRQSHITIYHTTVALLASTHFILTRYNASCRYQPITSSQELQRLINFSLDHVIPCMLILCMNGFTNSPQRHKRWNPIYCRLLNLHSCTTWKYQTHCYRWPSLLLLMAYCWPCQTTKSWNSINELQMAFWLVLALAGIKAYSHVYSHIIAASDWPHLFAL